MLVVLVYALVVMVQALLSIVPTAYGLHKSIISYCVIEVCHIRSISIRATVSERTIFYSVRNLPVIPKPTAIKIITCYNLNTLPYTPRHHIAKLYD